MQPGVSPSPVPTTMTGVARAVILLLVICAGLAGWASFYTHNFLQDFYLAGEMEAVWSGSEADSDARRPAQFLTAVPLPIALFALISALGTWRRWFWIRIFTPVWTWLYMLPFGFGMLLAFILIDDHYGSDVPTGLLVNLGLFALIPLLLTLVFILMFMPGFRLWAIRKKKRAELEHQALMHAYATGHPGGPPPPPPGMNPYQHQPPMVPPQQYGPGEPPAPGMYSPPPGQPPPGPYPPQ